MASVGRAMKPACELRLTIRPKPWRIITRPAAWLVKNRPLTLTSIVRSKSASVTSSARLLGPRPALFTRMSSPPEPLDDGLDGGLDLGEVGHVQLDRERLPTHRLDLVDEVVGRARPAQAERHVGTGVGQRECDRAAQATSRAGHECHLAVEREAREVRHRSSSSVRWLNA